MRAVDYGSHIAAAIDAKMILLHVVKREKLPDAMRQFAKAEHLSDRDADVLDMLKHGASQMLADAAGKAHTAGVESVQQEVAEGPIARTIVAKSEALKADMIVMGSRGMGDIEGLLRGGVSHRVEILAKCPVMIVK